MGIAAANSAIFCVALLGCAWLWTCTQPPPQASSRTAPAERGQSSRKRYSRQPGSDLRWYDANLEEGATKASRELGAAAEDTDDYGAEVDGSEEHDDANDDDDNQHDASNVNQRDDDFDDEDLDSLDDGVENWKTPPRRGRALR